MLNSLAGLLLCQLAGEITSRWFGLPVPGPVMGLVILCVILLILHGRYQLADSFDGFADGLLARMGILFVPAGVGSVQHLGLLGDYWLPIVAALLLSTVLTLVVTVATFVLVKSAMARWAA